MSESPRANTNFPASTVSLLDQLWAKTPSPHIEGQNYLPLVTHLSDTCESVACYWDGWLAPIVKRRIVAAVGGDAGLARRLARLLAALHDLGKCTPSFQGQVPTERERILRAFPRLEFSALGDANRQVPHAIGGAFLAQERLVRRGWSAETARSYVSVIAGHHGRFPAKTELTQVEEKSMFTGAAFSSWSTVQDLLFERCLEFAGVSDGDLESFSAHPLPVTVQLDLQALVVLADWMASSTDDFPLSDPARPDAPPRRDPRSSVERAGAAWKRRAIPGPWEPALRVEDPVTYYRSRFGWGKEMTPRRVQERALEIAREVAEPGLMIVEAPMGFGKTELALAVAETTAEKVGAGGVFFGLPTMATSDAMFERLNRWIEESPEQRDLSVHLAHSKAAFNRDYTSLVHTSDRVAIFDEVGGGQRPSGWQGERAQRRAAAVIADALSGRRTGIFANVVVGTIDQLLMVGLNAKHFALRHLAMSSKVVVLDEIHSADRYMRSFLVRALEWLGAYGTPVVLLSATLPPAQRDEFAAAYLAGARRRVVGRVRPVPDERWITRTADRAGDGTSAAAVGHRGRRPGGVSAEANAAGTAERPPVIPLAIASPDPAPDAYPLITWTDGTRVCQEAPEERGLRETEVRLVRIDDDLDTLVRELRERTSDGGCVLIVRNTVARAIELYDRLHGEPGLHDDLTLAHSRFLSPDRADNDEQLRERFGPPAPGRERPGRGHPAIVISTQVAEQSLDVDFDLLITDLAPADLVLQRIGRLHRHARDARPPALSDAVCVLTGVDSWSAEVPRSVPGSARIYGDHTLLRSVLAFREYGEAAGARLRLPADIPRIVGAAYAEAAAASEADAELSAALEQAQSKQAGADRRAQDRAEVWRLCRPGGSLALYGSSTANLSAEGDELARAVVRDGEDTFEIILMERGDDSGTLRTLRTLREGAGLPVPIEFEAPDGEKARIAAASTVRLPAWMCVGENGDRVIAELERQRVPSWQEHWLLRGQLVLVLNDDLEADLAGRRLRYSCKRGLEILTADRA